jgi:hypothetical protein
MALQVMELDDTSKYFISISRTARGPADGGEGGAASYTLGIFIHTSGFGRQTPLLNNGTTYLKHSYIIPAQRLGSSGIDMLTVQPALLPHVGSKGWGFPSQITKWLSKPELVYNSKGKQYITIGVHLERAVV